MQRNQINMDDEGLEANKTFLKSLYETKELGEALKWFDKLDCSVSFARQTDEEMTLDSFLESMDESYYVNLQIGSPFPEQIRYCARGGRPVEHFAWLECPLTESNYQVISRLFKEVYDQEIESVPIPEGLEEYHQRFG